MKWRDFDAGPDDWRDVPVEPPVPAAVDVAAIARHTHSDVVLQEPGQPHRYLIDVGKSVAVDLEARR